MIRNIWINKIKDQYIINKHKKIFQNIFKEKVYGQNKKI
jgi:hypothetical protein